MVLSKKAVFVAIFSLLLGLSAQAADKRKLAYRDISGKWIIFEESQGTGYTPKSVRTIRPQADTGITFNISYADVDGSTGFGFDDPTEGATRRATVDAVLAYLNTVLDHTATIDIEFNPSWNVPAASTLASAGTLYFVINGFQGGLAFEHITTGIDPSGFSPDIIGTVNFGKTWNSDLGSPTGSEVDLFSVMLHEFTHGLGVAGLISATGVSTITYTNPGPFSNFSQLLQKGDGTDLFSAGGNYDGTIADLTSDDVVFAGANATSVHGSKPSIYAPNPFKSGSSISHWITDIIPAGAVMEPSISAGVEMREYADFEIGMLQDLGYTIKSGSPTETPTATSTNVPPTNTLTPTPTATQVPPTHTSTFTPTSTATSTSVPPTATFTPTATATNIPPTATHTPTATATQVPPTATLTATATPTDTATATPTDVPPTETYTPTSTQTATMTATPTFTATATATEVPPTETYTPTVTQTPTGTATATSTPTATEVPPTETATATGTHTPTLTATSTATVTPTETVTLTPTWTHTSTATPTLTPSWTPTEVPATATATPTAGDPADIDSDGDVDEVDLLQLLRAGNVSSASGDIDKNGKVDYRDVLLFGSYWQPE